MGDEGGSRGIQGGLGGFRENLNPPKSPQGSTPGGDFGGFRGICGEG